MANAFVDFINFLIDSLVNILNVILGILPDSPFQSVDFSWIYPFLAGVNWLLPIKSMLIFLGLWLTAVLIYYAVSAILRIAQQID
ncbi:hypothetical protein LI142_22660 [Eubacterium limosum]|uniref:hypothetical protein n=1 Tax=Eubacterium limosum TaxID=1736 RepID=UPI001D05D42D|nr:hypothetical protein [Eubacterium limosum]MCB6572300.1 hypothetical protein [Eubacterium limosum]